jgi:hypothetical protein
VVLEAFKLPPGQEKGKKISFFFDFTAVFPFFFDYKFLSAVQNVPRGNNSNLKESSLQKKPFT